MLATHAIGVQWPTRHDGQDFVFAPTAQAPNSGGVSYFVMPYDGFVTSIAWQSSMKVGPGELLLHFTAGPTGSQLGEPGSIHLLSTHHIATSGAQTIPKIVQLPEGLRIPAGYVVWVYGEGACGMAPHPAGVEIQTTVYTRPA